MDSFIWLDNIDMEYVYVYKKKRKRKSIRKKRIIKRNKKVYVILLALGVGALSMVVALKHALVKQN